MAARSDAHTTEAITNWLEANPPRTNPPSRSMTKMIKSFVTESFPHAPVSELAAGRFKLADWGSGKPCSLPLFLF